MTVQASICGTSCLVFAVLRIEAYAKANEEKLAVRPSVYTKSCI